MPSLAPALSSGCCFWTHFLPWPSLSCWAWWSSRVCPCRFLPSPRPLVAPRASCQCWSSRSRSWQPCSLPVASMSSRGGQHGRARTSSFLPSSTCWELGVSRSWGRSGRHVAAAPMLWPLGGFVWQVRVRPKILCVGAWAQAMTSPTPPTSARHVSWSCYVRARSAMSVRSAWQNPSVASAAET